MVEVFERMEELINADYKDWLVEIKSKIRSSQVKAAIAVNSALIQFYWDLGKMITEKQAQTQWGDGLLMQLSHDLKSEFPEMKGLSYRSLNYARQFYQFYKDAIVQQVVAQIPWGHNILIISKLKDLEEAQFYLQQTIENNWSRDVLGLQIKSGLYNRKGKSVTNFKQTLSEPFSDLAQQTLNDPYIFDFLTLTTKAREKDIEKLSAFFVFQFDKCNFTYCYNE